MIPFIGHLEKAKLPGQKTDQWSPRAWVGRSVSTTEGCWGVFRVLFNAVLVRALTWLFAFVKVRMGFPVRKIDLNFFKKQEENYISFSVPFPTHFDLNINLNINEFDLVDLSNVFCVPSSLLCPEKGVAPRSLRSLGDTPHPFSACVLSLCLLPHLPTRMLRPSAPLFPS